MVLSGVVLMPSETINNLLQLQVQAIFVEKLATNTLRNSQSNYNYKPSFLVLRYKYFETQTTAKIKSCHPVFLE